MTTKSTNSQLKLNLAKVAAAALFGDVESTVLNSDRSLTVLVRQRLGSQSFIVELSRWGKLTALTRINGSELFVHEPKSLGFRALDKVLQAALVRELSALRQRTDETIRERFQAATANAGTLGESAVGAGHFAVSAGRSLLGRAYGEAKPVVTKAYGEAKPAAARVYGEVRPALEKAYSEAGPALSQAYRGAKRWLLEEEAPAEPSEDPAILIDLYSAGFFTVESLADPSSEVLEIFVQPGEPYFVVVRTEDDEEVELELEINWEDSAVGFSVTSAEGTFYPEIPEGSRAQGVITPDASIWTVVADDDGYSDLI